MTAIERSIKAKVEKLGTPLKDWSIQINYGIKTGYNDAFIINGEKRSKLIEQDPKSAEIIRPMLRGRDIKRYTYDFADIYIISTFPSLKIDIERYPAVKQHLLTFGYDRLKQTGEHNSRKKTNNQWFETQDSISYWDDFNRQKIVYPEITKFLNFHLDEEGFYMNNKCFFITGSHLYFLTTFLNSSLFKYCFKNNFPELLGGTRELRKIFFETIPVRQVNDEMELLCSKLVNKIQFDHKLHRDTKELEKSLDSIIFELYDLTEEEKEIIGYIEI